jgi:hypothetical protein
MASLIRAINVGFLKGGPHLDAHLIWRYLFAGPATSKGHLKQPCRGIWSTPLKDQFRIWQYKFPLQIKLIFIVAYIFLNFSIIMFYSQENCIDVLIPFD